MLKFHSKSNLQVAIRSQFTQTSPTTAGRRTTFSVKEDREPKKDKERLKQRKENEVTSALLQRDQPAAKHSKLVLPEPQISDKDLKKVVKLVRASEAGHVETPLMGGFNAPLMNTDFSGATPNKDSVATPNTLLSTPFRTPRDGAAGSAKFFLFNEVMQRTFKEQLKRGLSTLPTPKNDYEIIVPEEEMDTKSEALGEGETTGSFTSVEDQADIDARIEAEGKKQMEIELRRRSQGLQRGLPRPHEVNNSILRPANASESSQSGPHKAEELIKKESSLPSGCQQPTTIGARII